MIKVKDVNGNTVRGIYRAPNGTLIVKDDTLHAKHLLEVNSKLYDKQKIENLEKTVEELTVLVKKLLKDKNDN